MRESPRPRRFVHTLASVGAVAVTSLTVTLAAGVAGPASPAGATVPAGFDDVAVSGSVPGATTVAPLPDGRLVVLGRQGAVRIVRDLSLLPTPAATLGVCANAGERGLLGFAADPGFAANRRVYVYYTRFSGPTCVNRVSRFTMSGDTLDVASEVVLLDNIPSTNGNHNGGDLEVGADGFLYVAVGDAGRDPRGDSGAGGANDAAQDLSLLNGKVLRVTTDGAPAPGNPFASGPGSVACRTAGTSASPGQRCREIYAWGLRNPWRFAFDTDTGAVRFFINDVGQGTWEEVNQGGLGRNYGWNAREGACTTGSTTTCPPPPAGVTDPLTSYSHDATGCTYITGGAFVPHGAWPQAFDGAYLFADGGCGAMFVRYADGSVDYGRPFAENLGDVVDMAFAWPGDRAALYYVTNGGSVRRITASTPAAAPSGALRLQTTSPTRVYDTRFDIGAAPGPVRGGTSRRIDALPPANARAALVNITLANTTGWGYVQAWQTRTRRTFTSVLNSTNPNEVVANAAVVGLDADGTFLLTTTMTSDVIVDVLGYFVTSGATAAGRFVPLGPTRLVDTRFPSDPDDNPWTPAGDHVDVDVVGRAGLPTSGVSAVAFTFTALAGAGDQQGWATAYPAGAVRPNASNINTNGNRDVRANLVVVPVGAGGDVSLHEVDVDHLIVDVVGYFTDGTAPASTSGLYHTIHPARVLDTRVPVGFGRLATGATGVLDVTPPLPPSATAMVHNVTVTGSSAWGWVTAAPDAGATPGVSTVNVTGAGQTRAALALTPLPGSGRVRFYASQATDLVADAVGYFG
jgi:glucose/arabinose dehydrogenase